MRDGSEVADIGVIPWILSCLAWVAVPLLPLTFIFVIVGGLWAILFGGACVGLMVTFVVQKCRLQRPSPYIAKTIRSLAIQVCCIGGVYAAWRCIRGW